MLEKVTNTHADTRAPVWESSHLWCGRFNTQRRRIVLTVLTQQQGTRCAGHQPLFMRQGLLGAVIATACATRTGVLGFVTKSGSVFANTAAGASLPFQQLGDMASSTGDARHHPSALRNREFLAAELVKWIGQDGGGGGEVLETASGTGTEHDCDGDFLRDELLS